MSALRKRKADTQKMGANFLNALGSHLYPITDTAISGLSHSEQVSRLCDRGATLIQLREKIESPKTFFPEVQAALRVARKRGVKIIINDRVDIAQAVHADGVHLGQNDVTPEAARRLLGPKPMVGYSTHSLIQASLAIEMPIDYVAIGPIFPTTTKNSANPPVGLEGLALIRDAVGSFPLVAIGGITLENAAEVLGKGATAVALISDLWSEGKETSTNLAFP